MSKLMSITAALKQENVLFSAQTVLQLMALASLVEDAEYVSSTGSGEVKTYSRLTSLGLKYGENKRTLSPTKTEIKINSENIKEILIECHKELGSYLDDYSA